MMGFSNSSNITNWVFALLFQLDNHLDHDLCSQVSLSVLPHYVSINSLISILIKAEFVLNNTSDKFLHNSVLPTPVGLKTK